ncbi:MAG: DNA cytosine methyltransferase [Alphaproteobacteria bacterium]|nr:DNA cytosine methyltransferase [Alphaproteobacteria bacterium]
MSTQKKTCIDLFAGAGGLSEGLRQAGFDTIFANEISPAYSVSLQKNHPEAIVRTDDIRSIDAQAIRKQLGLKKGELDLLAGGPPCQGFSVNAPVRSVEDARNHLFLEYLRFVEAFSPKVVLIENVPGMLSFERGETVTAILTSLKQLGYAPEVRILFAAHYGVPQMRWRTIFIANRVGLNSASLYPNPTCIAEGRANFATTYLGRSLILDQSKLRGLKRNTTVADALGDLPEIENGGGEDVMVYACAAQNAYQRYVRQGSSKLYNHTAAGLGKANLERLPHIPPGGSWRDIPFDLLPAGMKRARRSDHTKRYGRLHPDGLGSTILTKCDPHWGTYIHPEQDRIISVREAARIQSFPDRYHFYGTLIEQYAQVGNAVPPLLAKAIGDAIYAGLSEQAEQGLPADNIWAYPQIDLDLEEYELVKKRA